MLRPRFLEFQKFFLLFLCVRARSPLYYTNFVILTGVLLIFPIKDFETFCTHEAKSLNVRRLYASRNAFTG